MKSTTIILLILIITSTIVITACEKEEGINLSKMNQTEKVNWFKGASLNEKKEILTPQQYHTIIEQQMEATFLGKLTYNNKEGEYYSAICNYHMFSSTDKFNGQTGWLNFENINMTNAQFKEHQRTDEIQVYSICGEYLGYVINNDALKSKKQFVINSESIRFEKN